MLIDFKANQYLCTKCTLLKTIDKFPKRYCDGKVDSWCFQCRAVDAKLRRKNRDKTISNYLTLLLSGVKRNAKLGNREFNITTDDLVRLYGTQNGKCALSNETLTWIYQSDVGRVFTNISVDRIDSTKGYTPDNIQLVCYIVNIMKNQLTIQELKQWCTKILDTSPKNKE